MLKFFYIDNVLMVRTLWDMVRKASKEEVEWYEMHIRTEKATKGKKRILDPFVGWIKR